MKEITFDKLTFEDLMSPMVYMFIKIDQRTNEKEEIILYIGKSKNGISRPLSSTHGQASLARKECNIIKLFICTSDLEVMRLEQEWIDKYKPQYNGNNRIEKELAAKKYHENYKLERERKEQKILQIKRKLF